MSDPMHDYPTGEPGPDPRGPRGGNELRVYDRAEFERDGRAGGPVPCAYCPRCRCTKSGYADEPNAITEACDDTWCPCHAEDAR